MYSEKELREISKRNEVASRFVAGYILLPVRDWSSVSEEERQNVLCMAQLAFDAQPIHQCYWNNRFCIATMCGMSDEHQRTAAWCLVSNGVKGYWEWITHSSYPLYTVLEHLGILNINNVQFGVPNTLEKKIGLRWQDFNNDYRVAPNLLLYKLVERYRLPTTYFSARILSPEEQKEREKFNRVYAQSLVNCVL